MYDKIKSEIAQEYYQQNFSNDGQRFVAWYLRNIHNLDENQTKDCITDGADDKQIDAVYVDDNNNTIYIIQGKFIGQPQVDAEPLREVLSSWIRLKDIKSLQADANEKLKRKLYEVSEALQDDYDIAFELIITSVLSPSANKDFAKFQEELADDDAFSANLFLVDADELIKRYDLVLGRENPIIEHNVDLNKDKFLRMKLGSTEVVLAALPLKECLKFPGIKDGTLFQKNVRQSLGVNNNVNKGIKHTIYSDAHEFFFFHNGVTAICTEMKQEGNTLKIKGLSIVNGCQSLNTILSCSEKVKEEEDAYIMFRFYEIPERNRADRISVSTNSQSAVKPRDLKSNDKKVLALKKTYEQKYPQGYLLTKRGEQAPADRNQELVIDLPELGKYLMSWQSQRPNIAYSESKIFEKYFDKIFKKDYSPEKIYALKNLYTEIIKNWGKDNPISFNDSLLAMKSYAPYHHMYAVSVCFSVINNVSDKVPNPAVAIPQLIKDNLLSEIIRIAGTCLNNALETAAAEPQAANRIFSPQNWIKSNVCLSNIRAAIRTHFSAISSIEEVRPSYNKRKQALTLPPECFEDRWSAD